MTACSSPFSASNEESADLCRQMKMHCSAILSLTFALNAELIVTSAFCTLKRALDRIRAFFSKPLIRQLIRVTAHQCPCQRREQLRPAPRGPPA